MPLETLHPLTTQLVAQYGDVPPATLIATTVETATRGGPSLGERADLQDVARTDVAALAHAVRHAAAPGRR